MPQDEAIVTVLCTNITFMALHDCMHQAVLLHFCNSSPASGKLFCMRIEHAAKSCSSSSHYKTWSGYSTVDVADGTRTSVRIYNRKKIAAIFKSAIGTRQLIPNHIDLINC